MDPRVGMDEGGERATSGNGAGMDGDAPISRVQLQEQARLHYRRGNRFFDLRFFDLARSEWRQAQWIWSLAGADRARPRHRLLNLRAVILLLLTVLLIFNLVYGLFPRNVADLSVSSEEESAEDGSSWWERWLETGHPSAPGAPSVTLREWWQRMEHRWRTGVDEPTPELAARPSLDERWEDLITRFRRNPNQTDPLDFHLIAGFGYIRSGDYASAVRAFEAGLADAKRPRHRADLYQGLANAYYYEGYHPAADGLAHYDLDRVRKAAEAYERSVQADPRALSEGNLGWMYFLLGEYERAERSSQRALALDKNLFYVKLNLGLIYLMENRIDDAFAAYRGVIRSQPEDEVLAGGINDLREVMRDHPGYNRHLDLMLGLMARANGDQTGAQIALRRFLRAPDIALRWRLLAERALDNLNSPAGDL